MCGITGIINFNKQAVKRDLIKQINDLICYRGPDDEGFYFDDSNGIGLGHRRLSILDLSSLGHQPMSDETGNFWITFNGEVYNYIEIREELKIKGYNFISGTDTEVILKAYIEWGEDCVKNFNGMWAFAIWDSTRQKLFCSRDRFGVKPFYYFINNNCFVFASEIKQILIHPEYNFSINKPVLFDFLTSLKFNLTDETFYKDINQLNGGYSLVLDLSSDKYNLKIYDYWDIDLNNCTKNLNDKQFAEKFYERFEESIRLRLRSDVPIASCLSGGLDSSSIVCMVNKLLKETENTPLQETYSSRYNDRRFDETKYITEVEKKVNIKANHVFPDAQKFKEEIENLVWHMDGPTINGSVYSQRCVFKSAHNNNIKVMLDGQGGDEVLAGYHSYFSSHLLQLLKEYRFFNFIKELYYLRKIHNYRLNTLFKDICVLFTNINSVNKNEFKWLDKHFQNYSLNLSRKLSFNFINYSSDTLKNHLYKHIRFTNMPSLLHYEDRNSMAFSIESRVPFLDYKLVEYAFSVPNNQKIKNGVTKIILRNAFKDLLPEAIVNRLDKMGFESPDKVWIHTIFKDYLLNAISSEAAKEIDIFNLQELKEAVEQKTLIPETLWAILGTIIWYRVTKNKIQELRKVYL